MVVRFAGRKMSDAKSLMSNVSRSCKPLSKEEEASTTFYLSYGLTYKQLEILDHSSYPDY
jgi:hypothetical protein